MFSSWGRFVYRFRWLTLVASLVLLAVSALILRTVPAQIPSTTSTLATQSGRADNLIAQQTPQRPPTFDLIFSSASLQTTDPAFRSALQSAIAPIQGDKRVKSIATPYTTTGALSASLQSKNRHEAVAIREGQCR